MKKFLLLIVFVTFTTMMNAQVTAKAASKTTLPAKEAVAKPKQAANPAAYACMKCYNIEKSAGKCSKCQSDKVQLGTYYCQHCMKACGDKPGKCPMCGAATTQITRKFCASKMPAKTKAPEKKAAPAATK